MMRRSMVLVGMAWVTVLMNPTFVVAAAQSARIEAPVTGDLRIEGGRIEILSPISGRLAATGDEVVIGPVAAIGAEALIKARRITIDGTLAGGDLDADQVVINGTITAPMTIKAETLALGAKARVVADVLYRGPGPIQIDPGAKIEAPVRQSGGVIDTWAAWSTWPILILGLLAALMAWRAPGPVGEARVAFEAAIGTRLIEGLIVLCVPPLAIAVFAVTLLGLPFAAVLAAFYALLLALAGSAAITTLGAWLIGALGRRLAPALRGQLGAVALGTAFLWLITEAFGLIALLAAAVLGLAVVAAHAERFLSPRLA